MHDRTVVITGTNTDIGRVTAQVLAAAGARVIMLNRSRERSEQVIADLQRTGSRFELVEMDPGRPDSVRQAAERVLGLAPRIDVLINNAGLAGSRGQTADGFELAFGVNHPGHYLLTALLWMDPNCPGLGRLTARSRMTRRSIDLRKTLWYVVNSSRQFPLQATWYPCEIKAHSVHDLPPPL